MGLELRVNEVELKLVGLESTRIDMRSSWQHGVDTEYDTQDINYEQKAAAPLGHCETGGSKWAQCGDMRFCTRQGRQQKFQNGVLIEFLYFVLRESN